MYQDVQQLYAKKPLCRFMHRRGGSDGEEITINQITEVGVPLLEIRPIFRSGDPNNRVDLVFFSADSCEFPK